MVHNGTRYVPSVVYEKNAFKSRRLAQNIISKGCFKWTGPGFWISNFFFAPKLDVWYGLEAKFTVNLANAQFMYLIFLTKIIYNGCGRVPVQMMLN